MPRKLPHIIYKKKLFSSPGNRRYEPSLISKDNLRRIIAIRNAENAEVEVHTTVKQLKDYRKRGKTIRRSHIVCIDDTEYIILENVHLHEYGWYGAVTRQLVDTFRFDHTVDVNPQYQLRLRQFNQDKLKDKFSYCVPDFCVTRSFTRITPARVIVKDSQIILLVECKSSGKGREGFEENQLDAIVQVRTQAGFLFAIHEDQDYVGAMVTIGDTWAFEILSREGTFRSKRDEDEYVPSDDASTEAMDSEFMELFTFGTVESDKKLQSIRKKLLKLFPRSHPPETW